MLTRLLVSILTGLTLACATTPQPLVYAVGRDDNVFKVFERNAEEIRAFLPQEGRWANLPPDGLTRKLLHADMSLLMLDINPGNRITIFPSGRIDITSSVGIPPLPIDDPVRIKAVLETIVSQTPESSHQQVIAFAAMQGVLMQPFSISADGKSVVVGEQTFHSGEGIEFRSYQGHFHVINDSREYSFDIPVWPVAGIRFSFPLNPYFYQTPDRRIELKTDAEAELAWLVGEGQLLAREEGYYLTRRFDFEPWQKLCRFAESDHESVMRGELAKQVEMALLSNPLQIDPKDYARSLVQIRQRLRRVWQALNKGMSGAELTFVVAHNAELQMNGKLLFLGTQLLSAGEGLRFSLCKHQIHVHGDPQLGIDVAIPPPKDGERLAIHSHAFLEMKGDLIKLKQIDPRILSMLKKQQIAPREHTYHMTEKLYPDAFFELRNALEDGRIGKAQRDAIRELLDEAIATELPLISERELLATIGRVWRQLHNARKRLKKLRR